VIFLGQTGTVARLTLAALSIVFLVACQNTDPLAPKYSEESVSWGQPVNGLQVGLARRVYQPGKEPGYGQQYFTVILRSTSGKELRVLSPTGTSGTIPRKLAGNESVGLRLDYAQGDGKQKAWFRPVVRPALQTLDRDHDYRLEVRLSASKFGLDRFGAGTMTATYVNEQTEIRYADDGEPVRGLWTGEATSGAVEVAAPVTRPTSAPAAEQGGGDAR
jgi:hypothetical protein